MFHKLKKPRIFNRRFIVRVLLIYLLICTITWIHSPASNSVEPSVPGVTNIPSTEPSSHEPKLRQDSNLVSIMQYLGLDYSKLNLINEASPAMPENRFASFTEPNTIYVHPEIPTEKVYEVVSHEYIHYVDSKEDSTFFDQYMDSLYQNYLYERMATYRTPTYCPGGNCLSIRTETKAIACTEMPDYQLGQEFIDWCNKHLPKRSLLLN